MLRGMTDRDCERSVLALSFDTDSNAFAAFRVLRELDSQHLLGLEAAAVVVRGEDGDIVVNGRAGSFELERAAEGGLLGPLIGLVEDRVQRAAVLAVVHERRREIVDGATAKLRGAVVRRSVDEVEAEIAVVEKAHRAAKRQAFLAQTA
jgi:hypothetical protein